MKKTLLLLIYFFSYSLIAQSDTDKAKAYYFQAETQYENGNARKALEYLDQAETLIGSTNGSIEALRVKAYYKTKDFEKAQNSLTNFYENYSDQATSKLQKEMSGYLVKIEEGIKERQATEKRKREQEKKEREKQIAAAEIAKKEKVKEIENELLYNLGRDLTGDIKILETLYNKGYGSKYLLLVISHSAFAAFKAKQMKEDGYVYKFDQKVKENLNRMHNDFGTLNFFEVLSKTKAKYSFSTDSGGNRIDFNQSIYNLLSEKEKNVSALEVRSFKFYISDYNWGYLPNSDLYKIYASLKRIGECQLAINFIQGYISGLGKMGADYIPDYDGSIIYCYVDLGDCKSFKNYYDKLDSSYLKKRKILKKFAKKCGL